LLVRHDEHVPIEMSFGHPDVVAHERLKQSRVISEGMRVLQSLEGILAHNAHLKRVKDLRVDVMEFFDQRVCST
jgi:hypothetical protein